MTYESFSLYAELIDICLHAVTLMILNIFFPCPKFLKYQQCCLLNHFHKKNIPDEKQAFVGMHYYEGNAKNSIEIDIDVRKRNKDFLNMKKVWRLLKY